MFSWIWFLHAIQNVNKMQRLTVLYFIVMLSIIFIGIKIEKRYYEAQDYKYIKQVAGSQECKLMYECGKSKIQVLFGLEEACEYIGWKPPFCNMQ